ncbi:murein hydrolase activator EnvC family protein [Nocardioides marmoraquaticus]
MPRALLPALVVAAVLALVLPLPAGSAAPDPGPVPVGEGAWPLQPRPRVVTGFDPPDERWGRGHRGVDLAGRPGVPVRSALPGRVAYVGTIAGVPVVSVQHGPLRTTYQPVVASVAVGDRVARGGVLGRLVRAGSHCFPGACLHWGLKQGPDYLDPLLLVGGGPVRLLPLDGSATAPSARTGVLPTRVAPLPPGVA